MNLGSTFRDVLSRYNGYTMASEPPKITYDTIRVDTAPLPPVPPEYKTVKVDSKEAPKNAGGNGFLVLNKFDSIEYDATHLWECQLDGAPAPFDKWFPAQTIDEPSKGVSVSTMSFGLEEVNVLNDYNAQKLRIELIDNDVAILEQWLKDWQRDVSYKNEKGFYYSGFRYLEDVLHNIRITKYTYQYEKVYTHEYAVLPVESFSVTHDNEPGLKTLNVNFAVFGQKNI